MYDLNDEQAMLLALHAYGSFRVAEELGESLIPMEPTFRPRIVRESACEKGVRSM